MGSYIWMNIEAHVWIWVKLRFGLAGERFPRESQSYMTDLRRVGRGFLDLLWMEDFKGMLSKSESLLSYEQGLVAFGVNLRID